LMRKPVPVVVAAPVRNGYDAALEHVFGATRFEILNSTPRRCRQRNPPSWLLELEALAS
jgi:hypothetical protein